MRIVFNGVGYLIPDGGHPKYIILPPGPNGSNVEVLEVKRHKDGSSHYGRCYVPHSAAMTVENAVHYFGPSVIVAQRTDSRVINPRIGA